jgi:hypothetical protein
MTTRISPRRSCGSWRMTICPLWNKPFARNLMDWIKTATVAPPAELLGYRHCTQSEDRGAAVKPRGEITLFIRSYLPTFRFRISAVHEPSFAMADELVRTTGIEPVWPKPRDFKSLASTNFATSASLICLAFSLLGGKCFPIKPLRFPFQVQRTVPLVRTVECPDDVLLRRPSATRRTRQAPASLRK